MKPDKKDKLIRLLLLIINQNNAFDALQYVDYNDEKQPELDKLKLSINEELDRIKRGEIEKPLDHMFDFVKYNIDKYGNDEKKKEKFLGYVYAQTKKSELMSDKELNLVFKQFSPFLSKTLRNTVNKSEEKRPAGRPRKIIEEVKQSSIKRGPGRPKGSKNKKLD